MERLLFVDQETAPVVYGGDITTELGLAESLSLMNGLQIASGGRWLDEWQGEFDSTLNFPRALMIVDIERGKPVNTTTPDVIELPAYFGGDFAAEAAACRASVKQAWVWESYDAGEAEIGCEEKPVEPAPKVQRQHVYDGRYYGSYSYYSRNR